MKSTIAVALGLVAGMGCWLAIACDRCFFPDTARFSVTLAG